MLRDLQHGVLDIVLALFAERPTIEARHIWAQELVWVQGNQVKIDPDDPVPLVSYGEDSTCQRAAVATLHRAGLDCNFVFTSQSNASLLAAVAAGFGVMAVPRGRAIRNNLVICEGSPLPKLPEIYCALVVREGGGLTAIEELADYLEDQIRVEPDSLGFAGGSPRGASR
jgi:DNA-binding transcriptional LysR family regulator